MRLLCGMYWLGMKVDLSIGWSLSLSAQICKSSTVLLCRVFAMKEERGLLADG